MDTREYSRSELIVRMQAVASRNESTSCQSILGVFICIALLSAQYSSANSLDTLDVQTPDDARELGLESLRIAIEKDGGVPLPDDIENFVTNSEKAIQLGKALFWDMQVGSDGIQACATCHFHAGADGRIINQINPNFTSVINESEGDLAGYGFAQKLSDVNFEVAGPNQKLFEHNFPFVKNIQSLTFNDDGTIRPGAGNSNDVASSMGTHFTFFGGVNPGEAVDQGSLLLDPVWNINGTETVRRAEPRNAPSVINAVFNYTNFWDGRARPNFNGQSPDGDLDTFAFIAVNDPVSGLVPQQISLASASLASQAVQPVNNPFEMAFGDGQSSFRTFPDLGVKLLRPSVQTGRLIRPLGRQFVNRQDSVLGKNARAYGYGLDTTYLKMIQEAFASEYWDSTETIDLSEDASYSQVEFNFALFFGLSVALYEATLVSDRTPFDAWMETGQFNVGFKERELEGLNLFAGKANCLICHAGPEFTDASIRHAKQGEGAIGARQMTDGAGLFDVGFHNIAVTPTTDDVGRGALDSFGSPLAFSRSALFERLQLVSPGAVPVIGNNSIPAQDEDIGSAVCADDDGNGFCDSEESISEQFQRVSVDGAFKTPGLRNVELTGPYFHNGGMATLRQAVQFYNRGGNFCAFNRRDIHSAIMPLHLTYLEERQLVAFMLSLTDSRVKYRQAPFDHPGLSLPFDGRSNHYLAYVPSVGALGSSRPLRPFLGLSPMRAGFTPAGDCSIDNDPQLQAAGEAETASLEIEKLGLAE